MVKESRAPKGQRYEFWKRMEELLGSDSECQSLREALDQYSRGDPPRAIRFNPLRDAERDWMQSYGFSPKTQVPWEARGYFADLSKVENATHHPVLGAGLLYIQEPGAMEAVTVLDPKPGNLVLDLSAAPGAKSTQIGERLGGRGWLVANDPVRARAERLDALVARHGILNASIFSLDPSGMAERFPQTFDRVLLDAPCSGESLFAKRQDFRGDIRDADVFGCAKRQIVIIARAAEMVKPGGVLVYSTCTYSREENEDVRDAFLQAFGHEFTLERDQRRWPHRDHVAGGYVAKFVRNTAGAEYGEGIDGAGNAERSTAAGESIAARAERLSHADWMGKKGLIRHGALTWDGKVDVYALAMSAFAEEAVAAEMPSKRMREAYSDARESEPKTLQEWTLDDKLARKFLAGDALGLPDDLAGLRAWLKIKWRSYTLGVGKAVGDRLNNALPKVLRN